MKKHIEINFPVGSHGVLYIYASCHTRRPLYSYFFETANQYIFDGKKGFYLSTKRLCFAECWFSFKQRWNNRWQIWFTVYSILIKAKARSNMNTALIRALTNVKLCVSKISWLYLYFGSLTKKGINDLSLDSTFHVRQGRSKISKWIWYAFDSCQRQGQTWQ